jgi:hypothetical protein
MGLACAHEFHLVVTWERSPEKSSGLAMDANWAWRYRAERGFTPTPIPPQHTHTRLWPERGVRSFGVPVSASEAIASVWHAFVQPH